MRNIQKNSLKLSIIIPAYNEEMNLEPTIKEVIKVLHSEKIPFEIIVVNDNSLDRTANLTKELQKDIPEIVLINRTTPSGFGRALRSGLDNFTGDVVIPVMADLSEDTMDIVKYYRKIEEGYDCVFGSRFIKNGSVQDYPRVKLIVNRITNKMLQVLFLTKHNDLTNAFKAYRAHVIRSIHPLHACHFNITIEMSLSALIRKYRIATIPIKWYGRTWGQSNLQLETMGRRYLAMLLKIWFERLLIMDDLMSSKNEPE